MQIYHIATAADWEQAQHSGVYTTSTRGRTLAQEGFIHASRADQWRAVVERFYADVAQPLVLLRIDTDRLTTAGVVVIEEPPAPGAAETFPHVHGPLPVDAVVEVRPIHPADEPRTR